jgi:hypothetical protein
MKSRKFAIATEQKIEGRVSSSSEDKLTQDDSILFAEKNRQIND